MRDIDSGNEIERIKNCQDCGNSLECFDSVDEYMKLQEREINDINLLVTLLNSYESTISK